MNSTLSGRFCVGTARGGFGRHRTGSTAGLAPRTRNAVPSCSPPGRCPSSGPAWIKSATVSSPNEPNSRTSQRSVPSSQRNSRLPISTRSGSPMA